MRHGRISDVVSVYDVYEMLIVPRTPGPHLVKAGAPSTRPLPSTPGAAFPLSLSDL